MDEQDKKQDEELQADDLEQIAGGAAPPPGPGSNLKDPYK
jgi:hypothetical protein